MALTRRRHVCVLVPSICAWFVGLHPRGGLCRAGLSAGGECPPGSVGDDHERKVEAFGEHCARGAPATSSGVVTLGLVAEAAAWAIAIASSREHVRYRPIDHGCPTE